MRFVLPQSFKRVMQVMAVASAALMPVYAYAACAVPNDGLIVHWTLDEASGTLADSSGGSHTGTAGGTVTYAQTGVIDDSLDFDGVDGYVSHSNTTNDFDITAPWTISCWALPDVLNMDAAPACSLNKLSTNERIGIGTSLVAQNGDDIKIISNGYTAGQGATFSIGEWHMFTLTWDGTQFSAYLDGVYSYSVTPSASTWQTSTDFTVAHNGFTSSSYDFWDGKVDDARLYNRLLSDDEIAALYATRSTAAPQAGEIVYNVRHNAMQYCDGTDWRMMGTGSYTPNAVYLDGTNDYLIDSTFDSSDSTLWTGSFWFKRTRNNIDESIVDGKPSNISIDMQADNTFELRAQIPGGASTALQLFSNATFTDTNWHHIMFSVDLTDTNKRYIYVDGVSDAFTVSAYDTANPMDFSNADWSVGADTVGGAKFNGDLADMWIDFGSYIDFSSAENRKKFLSDNNMPMYLGEDGSIPTGSAPDIFLTGATDSWETNKGTGGGFTENGALTTAATQPGTSCAAATGPFVSAGAYDTANFATHIWGDGRYLYVSDAAGGLQVFTHDGSNFNLVTSWTGAQIRWSWGDGTYIYTTESGATDYLRAFSFDGATLTEIDSYTSLTTARAVWGDGTYLYVTEDDKIHALTFDGTSFSLVASYNLPASYSSDHNVWGDGTYLYVADGNVGGILAMSFNGSAFTLLDQDVPGSSITNVWGDGTYLYVAANNSGLLAYSFDGSTLSQVGSVDPGDFANGIWGDGTNIYYTTSGTGTLYAYTFNGSSFNLVDSVDELDYGRGVWGDGTYIYFANGNEGIKAYTGFESCDNCGTGSQGTLIHKGFMSYNSTYNVMNYCNGREWVAMGPVGGTPPTSGLIGHWELDETSGTTAVDATGNSNGTMTGGLSGTDTTAGQVGTALIFDGVGDYINTNTNIDFANGGFTLVGWAKSSSATIQRILSKYNSGGNQKWMLVNGGTGEMECGAPDGVGGGDTSIASLPVTDGNWHMYACVVTDAETIPYFDGAAGTSSSHDGSLVTNANDWHIGERNDGAEYFNGTIDDIRLYNRALSPTEIQQLFKFGQSGGLGDVSGNCSNPSRPEGVMLYNTDFNLMQYCNGEEWIKIGH